MRIDKKEKKTKKNTDIKLAVIVHSYYMLYRYIGSADCHSFELSLLRKYLKGVEGVVLQFAGVCVGFCSDVDGLE